MKNIMEKIKMNPVLMKGIGFWLMAILNAIILYAAYWIGHLANGLEPMFVSLIISILMATEILLVLIIRYFFRLPEEEPKEKKE